MARTPFTQVVLNCMLSCLFIDAVSPFLLWAAGEDQKDLFTYSLEELLALEVNTATVVKTPIRNQPATISMLTTEEIKGLGARYLVDILEHIPGITVGVDVFGVTSLIFRGQWGHEGKVLLLIDDMPINDLLYGSLNLARHYPAEQIERVEVIRGAGAAKYGGNAQLAVIRVYTLEARTTSVDVKVMAEQMSNAGGGFGGVGTATLVDNDLKCMISMSGSKVPWSGETWRDNSNSPHDLGNESNIGTSNLIGKIDWHDLHFRLLQDRYQSKTPHKHGDSRPGETVEFNNVTLSTAYDYQLNNKLTLTPKYTYRTQEDWWISRDHTVNPISDFHLPAEMHLTNLDLGYNGTEWDGLVGIEYRNERGQAESAGGFGVVPESYFNGSDSARYASQAAFFQAEAPWRDYIFSIGARYNDHEYSGTSFVPRLAVVRNLEQWTIKGMYGKAFRDPNVEIINSSDLTEATGITAEETTQYEVEITWTPMPITYGTLALFYIENTNPIIYSSTDSGYFYTNNPESATSGIETNWSAQVLPNCTIHLGYSFYIALDTPLPYLVPQDDNQHLGAPQNKITMSANYKIPGLQWSIMPSLVWYDTYYAYDYEQGARDPDGDELSSQKQPAKTFANLTARYNRDDWDITLGVSDIFDEIRVYPQPYNDASTPYLGSGRTFFLTFGWKWSIR